eukprot:scaffold6162_cov116-Isochrysis_galbana.AAC.10
MNSRALLCQGPSHYCTASCPLPLGWGQQAAGSRPLSPASRAGGPTVWVLFTHRPGPRPASRMPHGRSV